LKNQLKRPSLASLSGASSPGAAENPSVAPTSSKRAACSATVPFLHNTTSVWTRRRLRLPALRRAANPRRQCHSTQAVPGLRCRTLDPRHCQASCHSSPWCHGQRAAQVGLLRHAACHCQSVRPRSLLAWWASKPMELGTHARAGPAVVRPPPSPQAVVARPGAGFAVPAQVRCSPWGLQASRFQPLLP
jgi:hypothetical protein